MKFSKDDKMNKTFNKSHNFFKKKFFNDEQSQKLMPEFPIQNYTVKNKRNPRLNKTANIFYPYKSLNNSPKSNLSQIKFSRLDSSTKLIKIKKIKIQKSLSEIFKNNDVDFVRNLNIDSQVNHNNKLNSNLNILNLDYFEKEKLNKYNKIIFGEKYKIKSGFERMRKRNEKFPIFSRKAINISHDIIKAKKKELKVVLDDDVEKKTMNAFKILKQKEESFIAKKKKFYSRIKEIYEEIKEIQKENQYIQDNYIYELKKMYLYSEKGLGILDEILEYKKKTKFYQKNRNIKHSKSFIELLDIRRKNKNKSEEVEFENNKNNEKFKRKQHVSPNLANFYIEMKKSSDKDKYDYFIKMQNKKINELLEEKKNIESQIKDVEIPLEEIKKEMKVISDKLMASYKESLYKGTNVRNEGLVWLIKSIWTLGQNVPMSFMPDFLDCESIDFLFKLARKKYSMQEMEEKISDIKRKLKKKVHNKHHYLKTLSINENKINEIINHDRTLSVKEKLVLKVVYESKKEEKGSMKDVYNDLVNQFKKNKTNFDISNMPEVHIINKLNKEIEILKKEIAELEQKEINRIHICFLEQNYENKFHTNIETVFAALVGFERKEAEMNKFQLVKKNYISNMKRIRFFDHKFTQKIFIAQ